MGDEFRKQVFVNIEKIIKKPLTDEEHSKLALSLVAYVESVKVIERIDRVYICKECHQKRKVPDHTDKFLQKLGSAKVETKGQHKIFTPSLEELRKE